jgi:multidrug efflux system outer membrane protein
MKQPLIILCTLASTLCVTGCMVGPRYQRPATNAPQVFRGATAPDVNPQQRSRQAISVEELTTEQAGVTSLGDEKWAEVFKDPTLQQLIRKDCGTACPRTTGSGRDNPRSAIS